GLGSPDCGSFPRQIWFVDTPRQLSCVLLGCRNGSLGKPFRIPSASPKTCLYRRVEGCDIWCVLQPVKRSALPMSSRDGRHPEPPYHHLTDTVVSSLR